MGEEGLFGPHAPSEFDCLREREVRYVFLLAQSIDYKHFQPFDLNLGVGMS